MTRRRRTNLTVDPRVLDAVRRIVGERGLSALVERLLRAWLGWDEGETADDNETAAGGEE